MPTLTRESRALLAFTLSATLFLGGLGDLGFTLYTALDAVLRNFLPADGNAVGIVVAAIVLVLSLVVLRLALRSAQEKPQEESQGEPRTDVWHHLAVAASWLAVLLVVMAVVAILGALGDSWPIARFAG